MAKRYIDLGYYIGMGGVVTFKNGKKAKEVIAQIPLEYVILETDTPYLSPDPFRGRRNDSTRLIYVARMIASLKGVTEEEVIERTEQNARELFHI